MKQYKRAPLTVTAAPYEIGKGMEDGFRLYSQVITNDGLVVEGLVKLEREDGSIVCPYVQPPRRCIYP